MGKEWERRIFVLGSYPHAGRILLADGFEGLFKWDASGTDTDYIAAKSNLKVYSGDYSLHLSTSPSTPAAEDVVKVYRESWAPVSLGLELSFKFWYSDIDHLETLRARIAHPYYPTEYIAGLGIIADGYLQYLHSTGTWVDVPNTLNQHLPTAWNRLVLRANFASFKYARCELNQKDVDLSAQGLYKSSLGYDKNLIIELEVISGATTVPHVYIDDLLLLET